MKPEQSEKLLISELFDQSKENSEIKCNNIRNIEMLTGDASTRKYYRIECSNSTYVVCLDNPSDKSLFVDLQKFFEKHKVRVPKVLDYNLSKGYILEEDLGDTTLLSLLAQVKSREEELDLYMKVIDELTKIHSISREQIESAQLVSESFDFKKFSSEIDFTMDYFISRFLGEEDKSLADEIKSEFYKICLRLSEVERVCTHRDFHSRNVMSKDNELIIIDFQDTRMGLAQYDLASLLDDCYYELDNENRNALMKYYYKQSRTTTPWDQFVDDYNDVALQRVFKAIGSFSYIFYHRKDHRYLKYIGFGMEKLKKLMLSSDKYNRLRASLMKCYYEK